MTGPTITLAANVQEVWNLRHLWREGALDRNGALFRLASIHDGSTHARLRSLCLKTAEEIGGLKLTPAGLSLVEVRAR